MTNTVNKATLDLIKAFEGKKLTAYLDPIKIWTIGYGHTTAAGPPAVVPGMTITSDEAAAILAVDVGKFSAGVAKYVKVPVNDNQFGAMVSFAYNVGVGAFSRSTLLKKVNAGDFVGASAEFMKWTKAGGVVLKGLIRRREAERALFLSKTAG